MRGRKMSFRKTLDLQIKDFEGKTHSRQHFEGPGSVSCIRVTTPEKGVFIRRGPNVMPRQRLRSAVLREHDGEAADRM